MRVVLWEIIYHAEQRGREITLDLALHGLRRNFVCSAAITRITLQIVPQLFQSNLGIHGSCLFIHESDSSCTLLVYTSSSLSIFQIYLILVSFVCDLKFLWIVIWNCSAWCLERWRYYISHTVIYKLSIKSLSNLAFVIALLITACNKSSVLKSIRTDIHTLKPGSTAFDFD